ncbi:hypothetical protein B0T14DRAFT_522647 [Immersiella caudata]|uniref:LIM zinc-binding domain-containing protein n=1 Tax=Immersiella caudata TaxID=314043 RepID=A0AA39WIS3_9PEZI|nr:hypothetical protein B0T14DRAFT_522647 [Immersiella caudata]
MPMVLDQALTGCMVVISCLDAEIQRIIAAVADASRIRWRSRVRMVWNESHLSDLLSSIRGQQTAITTLIQLLQMNTLTEIKDVLQQKQEVVRASTELTQSLRSRNPSVVVANSIYAGRDGRYSSILDADDVSVVAPSDLDFEFDDLVVNSQAYRRALARAHAKTRPQDPAGPLVEDLGDLIDFSDALTIGEQPAPNVERPAALEDLEGLVIISGPLARTRTIEVENPTEPADGAETDSKSISEPQREVGKPETRNANLRTQGVLPVPKLNVPCRKCGGRITGRFVRIPGKEGEFHVECIRCPDYNEVVASRYFPKDGLFFCELDYFRRFDLICHSCGKSLWGSYISTAGRKYHLDHLGCSTPDCSVLFGESNPYYEHEVEAYCQYHYGTIHAMCCVGCRSPIMQRFVDFDGDKQTFQPRFGTPNVMH